MILTILIVVVIINGLFSVTMARIYFDRVDKTGDYVKLEEEQVFIKSIGSGKPLVLLHGFLGSHLNFSGIVEPLSRERKVYVVDLPGFGLSKASMNGDYSKRGYSDLIVELLDLLNVGATDILGHSMGGEVALNLAYHYPERVNKLVLIDSAAYESSKYLPDFIAESEFLTYLLMKYGFQTYFLQRMLFRQGIGDLSDYEAEEFRLSFSLTNNVSPSFLYLFNQQDDSGSLAAELKNIKNETLVIWGEKDKVIPLDQGERLSEDLPYSTMIVIPKAGHSPMSEKPLVVVEKILDFLD